MKKALIAALFTAFLFAGALPANAQTSKTKKTTKVKTKTTVKVRTDSKAKTSDATMSDSDAEMTGDNPVHSETPRDPLYLDHPYFNGEPRWTHADSLYKHGDFPWALVSKNPDNFRFNPNTGQWEVLQTPNLGKSTQTR